MKGLDAFQKTEVRLCLEQGPEQDMPTWVLGLIKTRIE